MDADMGDPVTDKYNISFSEADTLMNMTETGHYEKVKDILQTYVVPFIILTGLLGNSICFLVFVWSPLKRISTSVYLAALAFSDTGFLVCLGIGWLESLGITFFHTEGICQITVYTSFVFSFTSIWFVNAFTLEMYIAVFHPRTSPKLCTPGKARKIVGLLTVIAGLIYIYAFWIAKIVSTPRLKKQVCLIVPEDEQSAMIFSVVDTVLTLVVPFSMIIVMIARLLVHVSRFYKTELESTGNSMVSETNQECSEQQHSGGTNNPTVRQACEAHTKLTRMLVVTVIVFLVLNLPSHAIKLQFLLRSLFSQVEFTETEGFFQVIFQILYYSNFSVNFLLYSACGRSFRSALMRVSLNLCYGICTKALNCQGVFQKITKRKKLNKDSNDNATNEADQQQHSRLVDIHLNEIRFSQLPSIESQFVCKSPPCLLAFESDQLLEQSNNGH